LWSENGISDWNSFDPAVAYDHEIRWADGSVLHCVRRERPWLLVESGKITTLFTSVYDGTNTWNQAVPIRPAIAIQP